MAGSKSSAAVPEFTETPGGVSVTGLSKAYGRDADVPALCNLSLDFPAGQCTVLLGPSGCGKTTILRSIAGLIRPDAGRIVIGDSVVFDAVTGTDVPPEKRRLGMVFQSYALWPHLTIARNIAYPLLGSKLQKAEIARKTEAMLEWVGLGGMGGRFVHELSGGQQQRVSLGRAMVGKPRAILFDEPLSNLDARLRERMRMELLALREVAPYTSIYVTHDQLEAMTLGDRVVVLRAGQIEQVGSPEDIYRRPRTQFVADFVGIPNLLNGTICTVSGSDIAVSTVLGTLKTHGWRNDWTAGAPCTVAIRPTLITLQAGENTGTHPVGRVVRSVFQGTSSIDLVDVGGTQITVESIAEERHAPDSILAVKPTAGAVFALLDD
jgi:iron(III) transport system ATP-binding protein